MKSSRKFLAAIMTPATLCSGLCTVFVLGQGGTGRETPSANANKNPSTPKRKRSQPPATKKTRAAVPAISSSKETNDQAKAVVAERSYWETIKLSTKVSDFKSYLEKYPNGEFAGQARDNLKRLEAAQKLKLQRDAAGRIILGSISDSSGPTARTTPNPGSIVLNQLGMELVFVPAGSFMMGSNNRRTNEKPAHEVTIKEGFYMGRYEVTQAEWKKVMGANPSFFKGDRLPVEQVSWEDVQSFLSKLNAREDGFKYRLPSEAEWEYASRSGTRGDTAGALDKMTWYADNSGQHTHPVGTKLPNAFGLYDMHGNVLEWCQDSYHDSYSGAPIDGSLWLSGGGEQNFRIVRGGAWDNKATNVRSAMRTWTAVDRRYYNHGFRVVAVPRTP